jgi:acetylornithine deacetylase/succinyl-diaminopimelate desuccinylase-like protein
VNCRVLPEDSPEEVEAALTKVISDDEVKLTTFAHMTKGPASPLRPDIMKAIDRVNDTVFPGVAVVPMMVMGATDGRYLRSVGIPTYGVQGFFMERNDFRAHGRDERMGVQAFYEGQTFLYELVKALSSGTAAR